MRPRAAARHERTDCGAGPVPHHGDLPEGPGPTTEAECDSFGAQNGMATYAGPGSTVLSDSVLTQFQTQQHASYLLAGDAGADRNRPVPPGHVRSCQPAPGPLREQLGRRLVLHAITACASTGGDALEFSSNFIPNGAIVNLQCIAANVATERTAGEWMFSAEGLCSTSSRLM